MPGRVRSAGPTPDGSRRALRALILALALPATAAGAPPALHLADDGDDDGWRIHAGDCAVVINRGADTITEIRNAAGEIIRYAGTWRGREGRYLVVPPPGAAGIGIRALAQPLREGQIEVQACPEALPAKAAEALAEAMDQRVRGFFGQPVEPARIKALFDSALQALDGRRLPRWRAVALFELGQWLRDTGKLDAAAPALREALELYTVLEDPRGRAAVFNLLGLVAWRKNRLEQAEAWFTRAMAIRARLGDRFEVASIANNLGLVAADAGRTDAALQHYETALTRFQGPVDLRLKIDPGRVAEYAARMTGVADLPSALNTLNNLAHLHSQTGRVEVAERYWRNYLAFEAEAPEPTAVAQARMNLGDLLLRQGRLDEALVLLVDALEQFERAHLGRWQAETLIRLGLLYFRLGDADGALAHARRAAALDIDEPRSHANVLRRLGLMRLELGRADQALADLERAAALMPPSDGNWRAWAVQGDLARVELELGRVEAALTRQRRVVEQLERAGRPGAAARAKSLLAEIVLRRGRPARAIVLLEQAVEELRTAQDLFGEIEALERLGRAQQQVDAAAMIETHRRAIEAIGRIDDRDLPPLRRAGLNAAARAIHARQVEALLERDRIGQAWRVAQAGRARTAGELRRRHARAVNSPERQALLDRRARIVARMTRRSLERAAAPEDGSSGSADRSTNTVVDLRRALDRVETALRRLSGDHDARPEPPGLERLRARLSPAQLLLSYYALPDGMLVWIVTRQRARVARIPDAERLEPAVAGLLRQLRNPRNAIGRIARQIESLNRHLLGPAGAELESAEELIIQPDGVLHSLPFALLPGVMAGEHTVRYALSLGAPESSDGAAPGADAAEPEPARVLVLADPGLAGDRRPPGPLPDESAVSRFLRDSALERLPGTRREAEAIASTAALAGDRVEVGVRTGAAATREFIVSGGLAEYGIVHLATHGLVDLQFPELSSLLLAGPSGAGLALLRPHEIAGLELGAELVVLSGCETGLGPVVAGEGAFSLARPFLIAGAGQVLASLWKIDDSRTARFMARFYHHLLIEDRTPAEALASAQQWMRSQPELAHPYYWAGFVITGAELDGGGGTDAVAAAP